VTLLWYVLLGALLAGYLALAGYDYGVGMGLLATPPDRRRPALNAIGPWFLGNEVWIVATVGVLLAAFPRAEAALFSRGYPVVGAVLVGLVAVNAGVQLRSRARRCGGFDLTIAIASAVVAVGWGILLGYLYTGTFAGWFPYLAGVSFATVVLLHGAVFLAMRLRDQATGLPPRVLVWPALGLAAVTVAGAAIDRPPLGNPVWGLAIAVTFLLALGVAALAIREHRYGWAFVATTLAVTVPLLAIGAARYPHLLPGLDVPAAVAGPETLDLLNIAVLPLLPLLLAVQVFSWWAYRRRAGAALPVYW
jgi:cytochrome d ubiquinol oxidase subunit II